MRRKYLGEIATRLRAGEVLLLRDDGTEEMVSVPHSGQAGVPDAPTIGAGITVADVLLEAVGAIVNGTESSASEPAKAVLMAVGDAVERTWTPTNGDLFSVDSVTVPQGSPGLLPPAYLRNARLGTSPTRIEGSPSRSMAAGAGDAGQRGTHCGETGRVPQGGGSTPCRRGESPGAQVGG